LEGFHGFGGDPLDRASLSSTAAITIATFGKDSSVSAMEIWDVPVRTSLTLRRRRTSSRTVRHKHYLRWLSTPIETKLMTVTRD
jgi:hypothetical protein